MKKFLSISKKIAKTITNLFLTILMGYNEDAINNGAVDLSGQGRNKYGR